MPCCAGVALSTRPEADVVTPGQIEALFTRADGTFLFARWGRPLVPVVFGVQDDTLRVMKGAFEAVVMLAGHRMAEVDPELGANLLVFFVRDWAELPQVPDLERLEAAQANQYRLFRFDPSGAIRAAFVFLRMDEHLAAVPAETLALSQSVQTVLLWSDRAFSGTSPLALVNGQAMLRPEIAGVIRAAYDPVLPAMAQDPSHALRLAARLSRTN